jgi:hypothetical protein
MKIIKTEHNKALFNNINLGEAKATATIGDKRFILNGVFSINHLEKAYKYEKEIQFQVWAREFLEEKRASEKYNRIEFYFNINQLNKLIDSLIKIKNKIKENEE